MYRVRIGGRDQRRHVVLGKLSACLEEVVALFYTDVSSRHAPYHTASIPPSGEAAYVIDGLLYHEADLSIAVHHTDGGGVSDHTFALAHLLGFRFVPRIPNVADRKLYGVSPIWPKP